MQRRRRASTAFAGAVNTRAWPVSRRRKGFDPDAAAVPGTSAGALIER